MTRLAEDSSTFRFAKIVPDHEVTGRFGLPWRYPGEFFTRLIVDDIESLDSAIRPTVLDIGCGGGLQGIPDWQYHIASRSSNYIGIEPDHAAKLAPVFSQVIRCPFEESGLERASIDLAYASMVIEHIRQPEEFFARLATVLKPGGIFWAFTVDRRHYFSWFSQLLGILRVKNIYLDRVRGRRGESAARYDNFPTYYRCNTPTRLQMLAGRHFTIQSWSLHRVGQLDRYVPYRLRRLSRVADRLVIRAHLPGSLLVTRMVRM